MVSVIYPAKPYPYAGHQCPCLSRWCVIQYYLQLLCCAGYIYRVPFSVLVLRAVWQIHSCRLVAFSRIQHIRHQAKCQLHLVKCIFARYKKIDARQQRRKFKPYSFLFPVYATGQCTADDAVKQYFLIKA